MPRLISVTLLTAVFGTLIVPTVEGGQSMNQTLKQPAAVPLDFLEWVDRDATWLRDSLSRLGVSSGFTLTDAALFASTVDALRVANRIRSFAFFAAPGLRPPYFDLSVSEAGGRLVRCVTLFPESIAPDIGALDFGRESFPAAQADPDILDMCRVRRQQGADYERLDRDAFRDRFFDAAGDLKIEFVKLNTDAAFVAEAIDHGFFVEQQDLTGRLRLGTE